MLDRIEIIEENIRPYVPCFYVDYLKLPDREITVLLTLKSFSWNHKENCYPSIRTIAERCNKKPRQVSEILQALANRGLLIIQSRPGTSSIYRITNCLLEVDPCGNPRDTPAEIRVTTPAEIRILSNININNKKNNKIYTSSDDDGHVDKSLKFDSSKTTGAKKHPVVNQDLKFNSFWEAYPKKVCKQDAYKAWKKKKLYEKADSIIADIVHRNEKDWRFREKVHIPNAASYLNGERWNDDIIPQQGAKHVSTTQTSDRLHTANGINRAREDYLDSLRRKQASANG